jgi:pimeloyl-ACP methyl ester carboxylesterase
VLIHGLTGDSGTWFELAPWIADHGYTATLVDQRGHGKSERSERYEPEDLAETLPRGLGLGSVRARPSLGDPRPAGGVSSLWS